MKKLLLTLFAVAAIVACQKEETSNLGMHPEASIDAQIVSSGSDDLTESEILDIVDSILGTNLMKGSEQGDVLSSGKADDRITLHIFQLNGTNHIAFVDDSNDDFCFNTQDGFLLLSSVHLNKQSGSNNIEVTLGESTNVLSTVNGDFASLFALNFNLIMQLGADGSVSSQDIYSAHNVGSIGGNTVRFGCAGNYYAVTDAPFPLNGHLATITDAAGLALAFGGSSLNYAGTDMAAVTSTIEAQILNGQ